MRDDDLRQLPASLADAVRACVDASGLTGAARASLLRELAAHMCDALDTGKSEPRVLHEFGDPELAGALIARGRGLARHRSRRVALSIASLGVAAMLAVYVGSAVTLHAHSPAKIATSADRDQIRMLAESPVDLDAATRIVGALLDRMYSDGGALTADGLRIVQRLKGVERISTTALVAEPVFFALPASRRDVDREWQRLVPIVAAARATGASSPAWRALEADVARFSWDNRDGFRYAPLAIVMPRLMIALRNEAMAR